MLFLFFIDREMKQRRNRALKYDGACLGWTVGMELLTLSQHLFTYDKVQSYTVCALAIACGIGATKCVTPHPGEVIPQPAEGATIGTAGEQMPAPQRASGQGRSPVRSALKKRSTRRGKGSR